MNTETLIKTIKSAINSEQAAVNKWKDVGAAVREYYPHSLDQFDAEKKALVELVIFPALPAQIRSALTAKLPRKGTAEAEAYGAEKLAQANDEKIKARAYQNSIWDRVRGYAFEAEIAAEKARKAEERALEKEEEETDEIDSSKLATNKAKLMADLSNWVKRLQKSEGEDFDIIATITSLNATIAILAK